MTKLYSEFGLQNKGYNAEDYKKIISELIGESVDDFFKTYCYQANAFEPILVDSLFNCGLELYTIENPNYDERLLGIKTVVKDKHFTTITDVFPGSSADMAKLSIGDEIIAVNGYRINNDLREWLLYFKDNQINNFKRQ